MINPSAVLVGVNLVGKPGILDVESSLAELAMLADTAGIQVVGQLTQRIRYPDPATYIRAGKVEEVKGWVEELAANMVIFDDELSPRHQRELEKVFGDDVRVLDRTGLILDIFAMHASTREGALQVELAQYEYLLPRLTRQWTHLARQAGGGAARGGAGGVGLRGPGETQLETDRRVIGRRIARLKEDIEAVRAHRERHRAMRRRSGLPVVALVGYTNAGKSTLLNRLTGADVYVADQLFATLDPTTRRIEFPGGLEVLVTDTVGFIQKLPPTLVAAFSATLEEISYASAIIHVVDASHPNAEQHISVVEHTLQDDLHVHDIPTLIALNKIDLIEDEQEKIHLEALIEKLPRALPISAQNGHGMAALTQELNDLLVASESYVIAKIPYTSPELIARFYQVARVESELAEDNHIILTGHISARHRSEFTAYYQ
jgi:GTP-binding protein HflX